MTISDIRWISLSGFRICIEDASALAAAIKSLFHADVLPSRYGLVDGAAGTRFSDEQFAVDAAVAVERGNVYLYRDQEPRFECFIGTRHRSHISLEVRAQAFLSSDIDHWLESADGFYEAAHPGFMVIGFGPKPDHAAEWHSDELLHESLIRYASDVAPNEYYPLGPLGISLRTYMGPEFVGRITHEVATSSPGHAKELGDGGLRIDVVQDLANSPRPTLLASWNECDQHFRTQTGAFAIPEIDRERKRIRFGKRQQKQ